MRRAPKKGVRKVIVFNTGDLSLGFHEYLGWDPEAFAGRAWESHVKRCTGFDDVRVEIRIFDGVRKRRVILFPGATCDPEFPRDVAGGRVVNAVLVPRPGSGATAVNVTRRVQKYIPGNAALAADDMFPFDDHEDNADRFSKLRILDMGMRAHELLLLEKRIGVQAGGGLLSEVQGDGGGGEETAGERLDEDLVA
jgi:hypothetical protein